MRGKLTALGVAGVVLASALSFSLATTETTQAAGSTQSTFIVPANDGYGVGDCALTGSTCGQVLADSWCEAQGFARSASFGIADPTEVTGAIPNAAVSRPISITCAE